MPYQPARTIRRLSDASAKLLSSIITFIDLQLQIELWRKETHLSTKNIDLSILQAFVGVPHVVNQLKDTNNHRLSCVRFPWGRFPARRVGC